MAYGIGSILGDIDQKADAYRNNPDALAQSYQQNQQLIDLLVLQKLKTDKEAAQRDMQAKMQTPAATIKDQRAQQVMGMTRNEVAQQVTPGLQALGQQMQAAQPQAQGIASVPAPNMQQIGMKGGGIIAFQEGAPVKGAESGGEGFDWSTLGGIAGATAMYGPALVSAIQKGGAAAKAAFAAIKNMPLSNMARRAAAPVMLGSTAYDTATTSTDDYAERFGFDPVRGTGIGSLIKELGIRGLGAASDLGNAVGFGLPGKLYRDKQPEPKATPPATPPAATTATPPAKGITKAEDDANLDMLEGGGGNAKFTSNITDADNERNVAAILGEDLGASKPKTEAVLKVPTEVVQRAPSEAQQSYAKQLADLRVEQESKLESLIAFLKGAGGQSSFAATMMGGSDAMNAREAEVKGEIMDVLGQLEAIDLKEQEFGIDTERNDIAREANKIDAEVAREQMKSVSGTAEANRLLNAEIAREEMELTSDTAKMQDATDRAQLEDEKQRAIDIANAKVDADNRLSPENKIAIIKMVNEKWADPNTEELVLAALNARRADEGVNLLRLKDVYKPEYVGPFNAMREDLINEDVSKVAESIVGGGGASGAGNPPAGYRVLGKKQ